MIAPPKAPLEITIGPDGKVTALDNDFLVSQALGGKVSFIRTSEILFHAMLEQFYIRLIKIDRAVSWAEWNLVCASAKDFDSDIWREYILCKNGVMYFPTYALAVEFEKWVIPALRETYGNDYV